jgi:flagellar basal body-associated protein FliL
VFLDNSEEKEADKNKKKVTKKGILITALLVTAIVGASFLVYLIPQ